MYEVIQDRLRAIEAEYDIKILYACESGSRAWGFPSQDSDYDVRFIYIHKAAWYLSIDEQPDVIDLPIEDELDFHGWDLRKTLKLLRKSNPNLLEWLASPIVYVEEYDFLHNIQQLQPEVFSPYVCFQHYLSMAKTTLQTYLQADQVEAKKYFYALRPIFACWWIEEYSTMPPIEFNELLDLCIPKDTPLYQAISRLLEIKMSSDEVDTVPKNRLLNAFITECVEEFEVYAQGLVKEKKEHTALLNTFFMHNLKKVWQPEVVKEGQMEK